MSGEGCDAIDASATHHKPAKGDFMTETSSLDMDDAHHVADGNPLSGHRRQSFSVGWKGRWRWDAADSARDSCVFEFLCS